MESRIEPPLVSDPMSSIESPSIVISIDSDLASELSAWTDILFPDLTRKLVDADPFRVVI